MVDYLTGLSPPRSSALCPLMIEACITYSNVTLGGTSCSWYILRVIVAVNPAVEITGLQAQGYQSCYDFNGTQGSLNAIAYFDNAQLDTTTCQTVTPICQQALCTEGSQWSPSNIITNALVNDTVSQGSCDNVDYYSTVFGSCPSGSGYTPDFTYDCPACGSVSPASLCETLGPFYVNAHETEDPSLNCAFRWVVYLNINGTAISQFNKTYLCNEFGGSNLWTVYFTISAYTTGGMLLSKTFTYNSINTVETDFGSCVGYRSNIPEIDGGFSNSKKSMSQVSASTVMQNELDAATSALGGVSAADGFNPLNEYVQMLHARKNLLNSHNSHESKFASELNQQVQLSKRGSIPSKQLKKELAAPGMNVAKGVANIPLTLKFFNGVGVSGSFPTENLTNLNITGKSEDQIKAEIANMVSSYYSFGENKQAKDSLSMDFYELRHDLMNLNGQISELAKNSYALNIILGFFVGLAVLIAVFAAIFIVVKRNIPQGKSMN